MLTVTQGSVLADRYVVDERIGVGGSGSVWRAHDRVLDRPVAVKVVPEGVAAARLAREARATAGIGVRNVVGVYDVGEQDGAHFLVMELVDGVDLATLLAASGSLAPELVALVGHDVARGVAAVHAAELVHRDVSPSNVLVTVEGEVKLTDLGIAQRTDQEATRRLTEAGTVVGTVDYLAPEQVEGRDVTASSDVYAAGLLLHAIATGRPPFGDGSVSERLARRLATDPADLGPDHGGVSRVIARAVQRDPSERYPDGEALREALAPHVPADEQPLRAALAELVQEAREAGPAAGVEGTGAMEGLAIGHHRPAPPGSSPPTNAPADDGPSADTGAADPADRTQVVSRPGAAPGDDASATPAAPARPTAAPAAASAVAAGGDQAAAGSDDAGPPLQPAPSVDDLRGPGVLWPILGAVVALIAVIAIGSALLGGDGDGDGDGAGGDGDGAPANTELAIVEADDHDPLGGGTEHGDDVGLAIDGDPDTEWDTEGYNSPDLGGLKSGVGLLLDLGEIVDVATVEVLMGLDGADVTVTVSEERPDGDPTASATVLGSAEGTSGTVTVEGEPVAGRWVALWFTSLGDDGGRYRAAVRDVRVLAP